MKKSQLSIFFLLVFVLLIAAGLIIYLKAENNIEAEKAAETSFDVAPIKNYFETCIDSVSRDALALFGLQGGDMETYQSENDRVFIASTYYDKGKNVMPYINELEAEYSGYLEKKLPICLDEASFPGFNIELGELDVQTSFQENLVMLSIDYPLNIRHDEARTEIRKFDKTYKIRMGHIYNVVGSVVDKFVENPNEIEYSYLMRFEENEFTILPYNEDYFLISVRDSESDLFNGKYNFIFGMVFE